MTVVVDIKEQSRQLLRRLDINIKQHIQSFVNCVTVFVTVVKNMPFSAF